MLDATAPELEKMKNDHAASMVRNRERAHEIYLQRRLGDTVAKDGGIAFAVNGLSDDHRDYLAAGGLGFLIGDGRLSYRPEQIVEVYYSLNAFRGFWFTVDAQHVANPAYNAERGPVNFLAAAYTWSTEWRDRQAVYGASSRRPGGSLRSSRRTPRFAQPLLVLQPALLDSHR